MDKINKVNKPLGKTDKQRRHNLPVSEMKQGTAHNSADIKRRGREHYTQLYTHKCDRFNEMNQFLEKTQTTTTQTV